MKVRNEKIKHNSQNGKNDEDIELGKQFGGAWGSLGILLFSHWFVLYLWNANEYDNGELDYPNGVSDVVPYFERFYGNVRKGAMPTWEANSVYCKFIISQAILAMVIPGIKVKGLPVPYENYRQLDYLCNAISGWYITLLGLLILHLTGSFKLTFLIDNLGPLTSVSMIWGNIVSLLTYVFSLILKKTNRATGNVIYDYFIGTYLNPRILNLDLKMWAEIRVSWIQLFLLTVAAALKQQELYDSMWIMIVAHFLYANACQKGEECIPTTWDIFYENWGFMLIYWNLSGVPFAYSFQSVYILKHTLEIQNSIGFNTFLLVFLLCTYYVWDTANSQKNMLRMQQRGTYVKRMAFPQLPWGTLKNPKLLKSADGKKSLLVDGWYKYARKIHYTCDICFALQWAMACGFTHFLPYYYVFFFSGFIFHRLKRDEEKCEQKYGKLWEEYIKTVPYAFIPMVI